MKAFFTFLAVMLPFSFAYWTLAWVARPAKWMDCAGNRHYFTELKSTSGIVYERFILVGGKLAGFERTAGQVAVRVCLVETQAEIDSYQLNWVKGNVGSPEMVILRSGAVGRELASQLSQVQSKRLK